MLRDLVEPVLGVDRSDDPAGSDRGFGTLGSTRELMDKTATED
jgi:hypothetical protein